MSCSQRRTDDFGFQRFAGIAVSLTKDRIFINRNEESEQVKQ